MKLAGLLTNQISNSNFESGMQTNTKSDFGQYLSKENIKADNKPKYDNTNNSKKDYKKVDKYESKDDLETCKKDETCKNDDVIKEKSEEIENKKVIENSEELEEKVIIIDDEKLEEIANILNMPKEEILNILQNLGISISMLNEPQNLINFLQNAFNLEDSKQLVLVDDIKNIMSDVSNIADSIGYEDVMQTVGDFEGILKNLENGEIDSFNIISDKGEIPKEIQVLLDKLNGEVVSTKTGAKTLENAETLESEETLTTETNDEPKDNKSFKEKQNAQSFGNGFANTNTNTNSNSEISIYSKETENIFGIQSTQNTKVFNVTLPKTQALKNINHTEVINQIMEKMKISIKPDISEMKILLRPDHLGEVTLKIATQNGAITAQFLAENERVKEIIEANFNQLKDILQEKGLEIADLQVDISNSGRDESKQFEAYEFDGETQKNGEIIEEFEKESLEKKAANDTNSLVNYSI